MTPTELMAATVTGEIGIKIIGMVATVPPVPTMAGTTATRTTMTIRRFVLRRLNFSIINLTLHALLSVNRYFKDFLEIELRFYFNLSLFLCCKNSYNTLKYRCINRLENVIFKILFFY